MVTLNQDYFISSIAHRSPDVPVGITIPIKARQLASLRSAGFTETFVVTMVSPSRDNGDELAECCYVIPVSLGEVLGVFRRSSMSQLADTFLEITMNSGRRLANMSKGCT